MTSLHSSTCTRCGSPRILAKSWTESRTTLAGIATVSYTKMVCADPECQKLVEEALLADTEKRELARRLKEQAHARRSHAFTRSK